MESKRLSKKNEIRIQIRNLSRYIETDTATINRLKHLESNTDFNINQVSKLRLKNDERTIEIEKLNQTLIDLDSGNLDKEILKEYHDSQLKVQIKENETRRKKKELLEIKKEDRRKTNEKWKATITADKKERYNLKGINSSEKFFFRTCNTMPGYILKKLANMPNNKGYIWKGIYCFGELPAERNNITVMFEKLPKGTLRIHEIHRTEINIYEKQGKNPRKFVSKRLRKNMNTPNISKW